MPARQAKSSALITKGARPILDPEVHGFLRKLSGGDLFEGSEVSPISEQIEAFKSEFKAWMASHAGRFVTQTANWSCHIVEGVTGGIEAFNAEYSKREYFVLKGEYPYHAMIGAQVAGDLGSVPEGSRLFLSHPFSASGCRYEGVEDLLSACTEKKIAVFLDCAYLFNSNENLEDLFEHSCVEAVCFSLSKYFCSGRMRSGLLFTRNLWSKNSATVLNEWSYVNHLNLKIHRLLMSEFSASYLWQKYRSHQLQICEEFRVEASDTVLFGLTQNREFDHFSRSGLVNRLCISENLRRSL
ncbi:MAG: hypothetical protein HRT45_03060 [Bdellovibrionales bacterium]|nr:hypothetical protein [Bdellovibrionales bacterium]